MNRLPPTLLATLLLALSAWPLAAWANDWPQILGPTRNGVAEGEQLTNAWPKDGLKTLWQHEAKSGYSGASVSRGNVILYQRQGEQEIAEALDARSGKPIWKAAFPANYAPTFTDDDGPRAAPVIAGERVYLYSAGGCLRCLDFASGKVLWKRDTYEDFNSKKEFHGEPSQGYFGCATSPLVEGNKVLLNVGGDAQEAGIVAFSAESGATVWKATSERASYSSPVAATVDGVRHVIFVTRLNVVSIDPESGKVRFRLPFGAVGPSVNAANPVIFDGQMFITASYGTGALLAKIKPRAAEIVWRDREVMASQYATCIEYQGNLFGIEGRQDGPPGDLRCFDARTHKIRWTQQGFGYATLLRTGNRLLIVTTEGTLVLAAANPDKYEELARQQISETTVRALPALADGLLYVRDGKVLKCLELRAKPAEK